MLHNDKLRFAGIGPRKTPSHVLAQMTEIGRIFAGADWVGVSGFDEGADQAWLMGIPHQQQEVWLPWWSYNNAREYEDPHGRFNKMNVTEEIRAVAMNCYKGDWNKLTGGAHLLFARNVAIMARDTLDTPVNLVAYWQDPKDIDSSFGGTNHAIRVAAAAGIPSFNIGEDKDLTAMSDLVTRLTDGLKK